MAKRTLTETLSDVSGEPAERTVTLGLEGARYELDLTSEEIEHLYGSLQKFIDHSRVIGRRKAPVSRPVRIKEPPSSATLRAWAASNGIVVPPKGKIPADIIQLFQAAEKPNRR